MADPTKFNKGGLEKVKSRGKPLGGAPEVKIPPLNAEPIEGGGTMQDQAEALRDPTNPLSPNYDPRLAMNSPSTPQMDPRALRAAHQAGAGPRPQGRGPLSQMVPPELRNDPRLRQGVGAAYMANQPELQNQPRQPGPLSEETKDGLQALASFQNTAEETQRKEVEDTEEQIRQSDEVEAKKFFKDTLGIEDPEAFFSQYKSEVDQLQDPGLKKAIEDRCKPLDLVQLLEEGEARQDVPIVPSKFIVTFRTVSGEEDLEIKRLLFGIEGSDQYAYDLLSMYQLAAGLYAINNRKLPNHLNDDRTFNKDAFKSKFKLIIKYPMAMLASMSVNYSWFDRRTRALFVDVEGLKNG